MGGYSLPGADSSSGTDAEKVRAEIASIETAGLSYRMDGKFRVGDVKCYGCGAVTDVHQTQDGQGDWGPKFEERLEVFGWQHGGGHWYCGKFCAKRIEQQIRAGAKVIPVEKINDRSYQARKLYAERATGAETTPAVAPRKA